MHTMRQHPTTMQKVVAVAITAPLALALGAAIGMALMFAMAFA